MFARVNVLLSIDLKGHHFPIIFCAVILCLSQRYLRLGLPRRPASVTSSSSVVLASGANHELGAIMPLLAVVITKVSHYSPPTSSPENLLQQITISFSGTRSKSEGRQKTSPSSGHFQHVH